MGVDSGLCLRVRCNIVTATDCIPGIDESSDDWRDDVRQSELVGGRNVLDHVVAEEHALWHEGARVSGDDGDRLGRVDEVPGDVVVAVGSVCVDAVRHLEVLARL